ncbi:MAG: immune inhibitor A domain-containing protein, partial [Gemmatimonadota bacterium]
MTRTAPRSPTFRRRLALGAVAVALALAAVTAVWWHLRSPAPGGLEPYALVEAPPGEPTFGFALHKRPFPDRGRAHALAIYTQFRNSPPRVAGVPADAAGLFGVDRPGSFSHFYREMSFGELLVEGTVLDRRYASVYGEAAYLAGPGEGEGKYARFVQEILRQADADVDYGQYDNDGPDGLPNSGDDDRIVDYVFIIGRMPPGFLKGQATGIVGLGFADYFDTQDRAADGSPIRVRGREANGAMIGEGDLAQTVGVMCHEFGHSLGVTDLYDMDRDTPEKDSAGIGCWGLMGLGALGWSGADGPSPMTAAVREFVGWLSEDNGRLRVVRRDADGVRLRDLQAGGQAVKIPLGGRIFVNNTLEEEYLLLEYRRAAASHYNRGQPADGLLVWHVRPHAFLATADGWANSDEQYKLLDLLSADGLFADRGGPEGARPDPVRGRDNLDFWANFDPGYRTQHLGNRGDKTDSFDGVRFRRLAADTNPSTNFGGQYGGAHLPAAIEDIRPDGDGVVVDIRVPRWRGTIREEVTWVGDVFVDGDLTVAPEGHLIIHDCANVQIAGRDALAAGTDPERVEITIDGQLTADHRDLISLFTRRGTTTRIRAPGAAVHASDAGDTWVGFVLGSSARGGLLETLDVRDADYRSVLATELAARLAGAEDVATAVEDEAGPALPGQFELRQNYPNPFNSQTTIEFSLPSGAEVRLLIYNALGQQVRTLED